MMHILAVAAAGVLERIWPSTVPLHDFDLPQDVEDECWGPDHTMSPLSGDSGDTSAAGVNPPAPAAPSLENWCEPAVLEVLAEHDLVYMGGGAYECECDDVFVDPADWREAVSPQIVAAVLAAVKTWPGQGQQK